MNDNENLVEENEHKVPSALKAMVWDDCKGRCYYCGITLNPFDSNSSIDHVTPKKQGGKSVYENLVYACRPCNSRKNARNLEQYREYLIKKDKTFSDMQLKLLKKHKVKLPDELINVTHVFYGELHFRNQLKKETK